MNPRALPRPPAPSPFVPITPITLLSLLAMLFVQAPLPAQEPSPQVDRWNQAAMAWVNLLQDGDFEAAGARVDPEVPEDAMSPASLATIWDQLSGQLGALETLEPGTVTEHQQYHIVDMPAAFQNQSVVLRVVLTDSLQVSGFFVRPPEPPRYEPPAYVDETRFQEVEVTVGEEPWELPGVLSLPREGGPFPALALVHGSGPNDRDETVGGNRPFRDLAWGLASRGIAVLRYDKRTRVHAASVPRDIGLDAEVREDALSALELLRGRPEVNPEGVFLLGHSLGGMLAPGIALRDGGVAGVVVMAAPVRPFLEVLESQLTYAASLEEGETSEARVRLDSLLTRIRALGAGELSPEEEVLGAPVRYWNEVAEVDPLVRARRLQAPLLVLQGGRDYQSTPEDLTLWREGLEGKEGVSFELYPELNHLFAPGEGTATPEEYTTEVKHVAREVVEDVAGWILARSPAA